MPAPLALAAFPARNLSLSVETLQRRRMLAGNVAVSVVAGDLVIDGDASANDIVVEQLVSGDFRVSSGFDMTTVNGSSSPQSFGGVTRDVRLNMAEGSDAVLLDGVQVARDVRFQGDDGDNAFGLINNSQVGRNLRIRNATGEDDISLQDSVVTGNVSIINQSGGSYTALNGADVDGSFNLINGDGEDYLFLAVGASIGGTTRHVAGNGGSLTGIFDSDAEGLVSVIGGDGSDELSLIGANISGDLRFNGRGGDDGVDIYYAVVESNTRLIFGGGSDGALVEYGDFGGGLRVVSADSFDLKMSESVVEGRTAFSTGTGDDHFEIDDSEFVGVFRLVSGAGDDNVDLEEGVLASPELSFFRSAARFIFGAGDDTIEIGLDGAPTEGCVFESTLLLNGGTGNDFLDHLINGNQYAVTPNVVGFETET